MLLSAVISHADILIDDFESPGAPAPWYSNGWDNGMVGTLSLGTGHTGHGAHLAFTNPSGTGWSVAADRVLDTPLTLWGVSLWTKQTVGTILLIQVTDATNQSLQFIKAQPYSAVDAQGTWVHQSIGFGTPYNYGGGANDGVVHQPISHVTVMIELSGTTVTSGSIDFDDVTGITSVPTVSMTVSAPVSQSLAGYMPLSSFGTQNKEVNATGVSKMNAIGFTWVRYWALWYEVERAKGVYNFGYTDSNVTPYTSGGAKILLLMTGQNPLYDNGNPPTSDEAITAYKNFAIACANHFLNKGYKFEVWNEPNLVSGWDGASYGKLAAAAIAGVHSVDPTSQVLVYGGDHGQDYPWQEAVFGEGAVISPPPDAIAIHPYRGDPETLVDDYTYEVNFLGQYYSHVPPIYISEWGYDSANLPQVNPYYSFDDNEQAAHYVRELFAWWGVHSPFNIMYEMTDDGTDNSNEQNKFGITTNVGADKPATVALRTASAIIHNDTIDGYMDTGMTEVYAARFHNAGQYVLAIWADRHGLSIPVQFDQTPTQAIDYLGNTVNVSVVNGHSQIIATDNMTYVTFSISGGTDRQAPTAPSNLVLSNPQATSLTLGWTAATDNVGVAGYDLDVSTDALFTTFVTGYSNANLGNVTSTTITGLSPSTVYDVRLRAYDAAGNTSINSSVATGQTAPPACTPLRFVSGSAAPATVAPRGTYSVQCDYGQLSNAIQVAPGSGVCHWTGSAGTSEQFQCTAGAVLGTFANACKVVSGTSSNNCAQTNPINSTTVTMSTGTDTVPPSVPTGLQLTEPTTSSFLLVWTASTDNVGVVGYDLDVSLDSRFIDVLSGYANLSVGDFSQTLIDGLAPGTTYYVRLRAFDAAGNISGYSMTASNVSLPPQRAAQITMTSSIQVYPNPWRADRGYPAIIRWASVPSGSRLRIFTLSGHLVRDLTASAGSGLVTVSWNMQTDSGDPVASGLYLYVVNPPQGGKSRGKFAIIK